MGRPQPATKIKTDNSTADGIVNNAIKQNCSKAIDMRSYWLKDRQQQKQFSIYWDNGKNNFADYFTKIVCRRITKQSVPSTYLTKIIS